MSTYFKEQELRNKRLKGKHPANALFCGCESCLSFQSPMMIETHNHFHIQYDSTTITRQSSLTQQNQQYEQQKQQKQQSLTCFPILQPMGWTPCPQDACFPYPPFYCCTFFATLQRKLRGESVKGRPAHDRDCRVRMTSIYGRKTY